MRRPPDPRAFLLPVDHEAFQPRRQDRLPVGAGGCHPQSANVP